MTAASAVAIVGGAVWVAGRWATQPEHLALQPGETEVRATIPLAGAFGSERLPRADRITQLGALALCRALEGVAPGEPPGLSVITASVMATAHTNERFERRRIEGKSPEPRAFPFTAPNAAGGELAIAITARGPTLALVGGAEVAIAALERACRWIALGRSQCVAVIATECPPQTPALVAPPGIVPAECAAAVILMPADAAGSLRKLVVRWTENDPSHALGLGPLLSVEALARVVFAARDAGEHVIAVRSAAGASLEAHVG